ncbi:MAG: YbaK/EbsC family protein [Candidatus Kerfeldbacteria bacterium]
MTLPTKTTKYLDSHKVKYETVPHKTVFTAYDLAQTLKTPLEEIAKTLLVKADAVYHLVLLRASDRLDVPKLKKALKVKKLSIANEKDMVRELKVKPGAITPFAGMHKLAVVIDKALAKTKRALFGSGSFEHSIRMRTADFMKMESPATGAFGTSAKLKLQVKAKR